MSFLDFEFEILQDGKKRLDLALKEFLADSGDHGLSELRDKLTRNKLSKLISQGFVRVDDEVVTKAGFVVSPGDVVQVSIPTEVLPSSVIEPSSDVRLDIVYEDDDLLVLNKQAGIIVHPGTGGEQGTLAHGLVAYLGEKILEVGHPLRPGIVHRLDKETSGLMVVAKTNHAYQQLTTMFLPPRQISRKYIALVTSLPDAGLLKGTINLPILRHPTQRTKMLAGKNLTNARAAVTHWHVVSRLKFGYILELELETGRTHQIRVHLQAHNSHIFGDDTYGFSLAAVPNEFRSVLKQISRVALHAKQLIFKHPVSGKLMEFVAKIPVDMQRVIEGLHM